MAEPADIEVLPLAELPESQRGESRARHKHYTATVSNANGYLCSISVDAKLHGVPPEFLFAVFSHPDNAGAFRDVKRVGYRKVISDEGGLKRVEVEQCGELRVLWVRKVFRTYLDVTEDARDPECLTTDFRLLRSDILSRFHGAWQLRPMRDADGQVTGCHAVLAQEILPRGVPTFFAHLPVLGGLLRKVSLTTIQRLMDDIMHIAKTFTDARGALSVDQVLAAIAAQRGHTTSRDENRAAGASRGSSGGGASSGGATVASFAIGDDFSSESSEASESEPEGAAGEQAGAGMSGSAASSPEPADAAAARLACLGGLGGAAASSSASASASSSARGSADGGVQVLQGAPPKAGGQRHHHRPHPAVGVLLDVSVHDSVHVALVPNPDA